MHYLCFEITGQISKILKIRQKGFKKALKKKYGESVYVGTAQSISLKNTYRNKTQV